MKPLMMETHDTEALADLGRAAVQIIHDLKNQINGLKLYATFLRKRLEKGEGHADELETVAKLNAGLERAAADMTTLVRYGRPVELRRAPHVDLRRVLAAALERELEADDEIACQGEFDQTALAEALKHIDAGLPRAPNQPAPPVRLKREAGACVIEWRGIRTDSNPFDSFAGGAGLRLALAAKIVRAHGGRIEHDANMVRVHLPLTG
jgi:signal transduction histidine kinase